MINKAFLMGRLTRDPEVRHTQSGKSVCSFSVAVNRAFVAQGQERQTDFIDVVAWGNTADFVGKWFSKGKMIIVEGRIQSRSWEGNDGKKNYATEVIADQVHFGESKRDGDSSYGGGGGKAPQAAQGLPDVSDDDFVPIDTGDDDLPF